MLKLFKASTQLYSYTTEATRSHWSIVQQCSII